MLHPPHQRTRGHGFSLVELLVVISIAAIVLALSVPSVRGLLLQGQVAGAATTLSAAADSARRHAQSRAYETGFPEGAQYGGVAAIVTPDHQIRLAIHDLQASFTVAGPPVRRIYFESRSPQDRYAGFRDIEDLDYINFSEGVDVYGIDYQVNAPPNGRVFLPPPFAIRFDASGRLVIGSRDSHTSTSDALQAGRHRLVLYRDFDNDNVAGVDTYDRGEDRTPEFEPGNAVYDPQSFTPTYDNDPDYERTDLPFGLLEAVGAVRVVLAGEDPVAPASGFTDVVFSRYSGASTRIPGP